MRLGLSSEAAPDLTLPELVDACGNRGLTSLEVVGGGGHGIEASLTAAAAGAVVRLVEKAGVSLAALYLRVIEEEPLENALRAASLMRTPLLLSLPEPRSAEAGDIVREASTAGCRILFLHRSDADVVESLADAVRTRPPGAAGLAWEVDPRRDEPGAWTSVLRIAGSSLAYVRLRGGGPESLEQTGLGVGALMARLALSAFQGPLVLTPSDRRYHRAWRSWLGRGGGWGCGSKQADGVIEPLSIAS
jgi:hypothetical protein